MPPFVGIVSIPFKRESVSQVPTISTYRTLVTKEVSIPFKREGGSQVCAFSILVLSPSVMFPFPSNGKADRKGYGVGRWRDAINRFNSLQTGRRIASMRLLYSCLESKRYVSIPFKREGGSQGVWRGTLERCYQSFQFPSNGKADRKNHIQADKTGQGF